MKRKSFVEMWLEMMLRLMKKRKGFVNQTAAEGHIRKQVFSTSGECLAGNIRSAENLVRMMLLWARDCVLMDNEEVFDHDWMELGRYAERLMREHGQDFCEHYRKNRKP